jgi:hypothetical protein
MASDEFSDEGPSQRPTVQVGDPFMEKLLLEACLEIFARTCSSACRTWARPGSPRRPSRWRGAAAPGSSSTSTLVPQRARGLTPTRCCSASRRSACSWSPSPAARSEVFEICGSGSSTPRSSAASPTPAAGSCAPRPATTRWPTSTPSRARPWSCAISRWTLLTDEAPKYDRPRATTRRAPRAGLRSGHDPVRPPRLLEELLAMLGSPNIGSRAWVYRQYDHIVRGGTALRPGRRRRGGARPPAEGRAHRRRRPRARGGRQRLLALATDVHGRYCELDPREGAKMAVAEVCRNLVCAGAEPVGSPTASTSAPRAPRDHGPVCEAIDGMAEACRALAVPDRERQRLALQRDRRPRDLPHADPRRAWASSRAPGTCTLRRVPASTSRRALAVRAARRGLLGLAGVGTLGGSEWTLEPGTLFGEDPSRGDLAERNVRARRSAGEAGCWSRWVWWSRARSRWR